MLILKVLSRLLDYPSESISDHSAELIAAVSDSDLSVEHKEELITFINTLATTDLYDAQERYDLLFERAGHYHCSYLNMFMVSPEIVVRPWSI